MPRGCESDQPRVMVCLSVWSAFSCVYLFLTDTRSCRRTARPVKSACRGGSIARAPESTTAGRSNLPALQHGSRPQGRSRTPGTQDGPTARVPQRQAEEGGGPGCRPRVCTAGAGGRGRRWPTARCAGRSGSTSGIFTCTQATGADRRHAEARHGARTSRVAASVAVTE